MKGFSLAAVVVAATLAVSLPSAVCDSYGYRTSEPKVRFNSSFDSGREAAPNGIAESGIFANKELSNSGWSNDGVELAMNKTERPIDDAFLHDNSLKGGTKGGKRDKFDALVDPNVRDVVLLSGIDGGGLKSGGKNPQVSFADKGTFNVSNEQQRGNETNRSNTTAPTETPGTGLSFLLGTGLLGLALALFWIAAKRATGS